MFYRRKIVLALIQMFEESIEKTRLQKLLFLLCQKQIKKEYDFVPYKFGCFSFSANADLVTLIKKGILEEGNTTLRKSDRTDYIKQLKEPDKKVLLEIKALYGKMGSQTLIRHTYLNFPYYAINSEIASEILSEKEIQKVALSRPENNSTILFTIGYEGISLEEYLNRLLKNDIKVLIDVRNNPLSQKFGFSKTQLSKYCESLKIKYIHFPEVGIKSDQRQELNSQADYDKLFSSYRNENLTKTISAQEKILDLLLSNKRIALTCFEANIYQCHRKSLAEAIAKLPKFKYEIKHI
jgi:uncharacterized protein (DUF488 family)